MAAYRLFHASLASLALAGDERRDVDDSSLLQFNCLGGPTSHCGREHATPQNITGNIYCDNYFEFWFNGKFIKSDAIAGSPHQAVAVSFEWDGKSKKQYAIMCQDKGNETGWEYLQVPRWNVETNQCCHLSEKTGKLDMCLPELNTQELCEYHCHSKGCGYWETEANSARVTADGCDGCGAWVGDGALLAEFSDGTRTSRDWKILTVNYGPTDASIANGCGFDDISSCALDTKPMPDGWQLADFDDSAWSPATEYTVDETGWGRAPCYHEDVGECCGFYGQNRLKADPFCVKMQKEDCLSPKEVMCPHSRPDCPEGSDCHCGCKLYCESDQPSCTDERDGRPIWGVDLMRDNVILFRN